MRIETTVKDLRDAIAKACAVIKWSGKPTIPVLRSVLINASSEGITIEATDVDNWIKIWVDGQVLSEGRFLLPAANLRNLLSGFSAWATVDLSEPEGQPITATITDGDQVFTWTHTDIISPDDFPENQHGDALFKAEFHRDDFRNMFDRVNFAVSREETRYYLNGVFLHVDAGKLATVATDGHRMAIFEAPSHAGIDAEKLAAAMPQCGPETGVIVPRKYVNLILKFLPSKGTNQPVEFSLFNFKNNSQVPGVLVTVPGHFTLSSRTIDGTYPDFKRIIPDIPRTQMTVDRLKLSKTVSPMVSASKSQQKGISIDVAEAELSVSMSDVLTRTHCACRIPAHHTGEPATIGINGQYLKDILAKFTGETVDFHLSEKAAGCDPILIYQPKSDPGFLCVQMPMRI